MTEEIHKYGTDDGWHGVIAEGIQFAPEKDRYHLYIGISSYRIFTYLVKAYHTHRSVLPLRPSGQPRPAHQTLRGLSTHLDSSTLSQG